MFAVVLFTKESDDNIKSVQEVPVSWLSEDKKFCRWPPKNSSIYTAKNVPPQEDWPWHAVEVEIICDSLKEAKRRSQKDVSTDDDQLGKGFRVPKPKTYFSPDTCIPKKKLSKDQYELPPSLPNVALIPSEDMAVPMFVNNIIEKVNAETEPDPTNVLTEIGNSKRIEICSQHSEASCSGSEETLSGLSSTSHLERKFEKIIEILSEHRLILDELLQKHRRVTSPLPALKFGIPVETLEDVISLEEKLQDKKVKELENVGGCGSKDFIYRLMKTVFTNRVGELCSWTGAKNNFKVSSLKITAALYNIVHTRYDVSQRDFEFHVRDWLKNSKQRRVREEVKTKNDLTFPVLLPG